MIFLHGICSSRIEALSYLEYIVPNGISMFCFDFSGSGKSEGEYVSLGWNEAEDLEQVITYLRKTARV